MKALSSNTPATFVWRQTNGETLFEETSTINLVGEICWRVWEIPAGLKPMSLNLPRVKKWLAS